MKIIIIGSMRFSDEMVRIAEELKRFGHEPVLSNFIERYIGKSPEKIEMLKLEDKNEHDAVKEFWNKMQDCDAALVLNFDHNGISNYICGNSLMDIGFAYVLGLKIFLFNPIPKIKFYKSEIEAVRPIIIYGDLSKIE